MAAIGLTVTRLIRVAYGPFQLGSLRPGDIEEVAGKVLREQLSVRPASGQAWPRRPPAT